MKLNTVLLVVLIGLTVMGLARAQEMTPEPGEGIPACTEEELVTIRSEPDSEIRSLLLELKNGSYYESIGEMATFVAATNHALWYKIDRRMPDCAEKYTVGHELGHAFDHYLIAVGLEAAARAETDTNISRQLSEKSQEYLGETIETIRSLFPDTYGDFTHELTDPMADIPIDWPK